MTKNTNSEIEPFMISHTFNAPIELMWEMWADLNHMKKWWGPKGTKIKYAKSEFHIGGHNLYCMINPDGKEMWGKIVYREITKPERLMFETSFSNELGELTRHPMSPTWPLEMLTTVTFLDNKGKTTVTIEWVPLNATEEEKRTFDEGRASMTQGWNGSFEVLENYLSEVRMQKNSTENLSPII